VLYGVIVTIAGLTDDDAAIDKAQGVNINLWTGLGMLLPSRPVAFLGTIVVPLGLWFVLRGTDAQGWLTPFAAVQNLLSGRMTAVMWAQWLVVSLVWGVGLNVAGTARLRR